MAITVGVTEKRLANKRFSTTENTILQTFLREHKHHLSAKLIAKKAGVARSTIYRHHRNLQKIIPDYEKYILSKFYITICKTFKSSNSEAKAIYFKTLCFIATNKKVFQMLIYCGDDRVFHKMILKITPHLKKSMNLPKNSQTLYAIYISEVVEILKNWSTKDFAEPEINSTLNKIIFLTKTARGRLNKLLD